MLSSASRSLIAVVVGFFAIGAIADEAPFWVDRVGYRYQEWTGTKHVRLTEYNANHKPRLRSRLAGSRCRKVGELKWKLLPMELEFPARLSAQPTVGYECLNARGVQRNIAVYFDIGDHIDSFEVQGRSRLDADILMAPSGQLMRLGPAGEMRFYRRVNGLAEDFKPHRVGGKLYYSYMINAVHAPGVSTAGYRTILNSRYEPIETVDFLTDLHEFEYLGKNHYLYLSYDAVNRADGSCYIEQSVIEKKGDRVLRKFDVSEYLRAGHILGPSRMVEYRGRECEELSHLNSVQILNQTNWLIGLGRGVVAAWDLVDRKASWILGRIGGQIALPDSISLAPIHTPRFSQKDGRFVVFENGLGSVDVKIVDLKLDLVAKRATLSRVLTIAGLQSSHSGSVEAHGSIYSIGAGSREKGDWDFMEYDGDQQTFAVRFSSTARNYRVYRSL